MLADIRRTAQRPRPEICFQTLFRLIRAGRHAFPHNGRTLNDDVVEVFLRILKNAKTNGDDKVGPHGDLLDEFPYLGPQY
jgi:hypothetical protein